MNFEWIDEYCKTLKGAVKEYKLEWGVFRFMLTDKMFLMLGKDNHDRQILTLKLKPDNGQYLREKYPDIREGYYMNKIHWNSVDLNGDVPQDEIKKMITESYQLVLGSLKKADRLKIVNE